MMYLFIILLIIVIVVVCSNNDDNNKGGKGSTSKHIDLDDIIAYRLMNTGKSKWD